MEPYENVPQGVPGEAQDATPDATPDTTRTRHPWRTAGLVLAGVLIVAGLTVVGFLVVFVVALNNWGSNK